MAATSRSTSAVVGSPRDRMEKLISNAASASIDDASSSDDDVAVERVDSVLLSDGEMSGGSGESMPRASL